MEPDSHAPAHPGGGNMIEATQETRGEWLVVAVKGRADSEAADQLEAVLRAA